MKLFKRLFKKGEPEQPAPAPTPGSSTGEVKFTGHNVTVQPTSEQVVARNASRLGRLRKALQDEASKAEPDSERMRKLNLSIRKYQALQDYYDLSRED